MDPQSHPVTTIAAAGLRTRALTATTPFILINGYRPSTKDQITVNDDSSIHDETFEFVFCPGVEFSISLEKDFDMGKVVIRLQACRGQDLSLCLGSEHLCYPSLEHFPNLKELFSPSEIATTGL